MVYGGRLGPVLRHRARHLSSFQRPQVHVQYEREHDAVVSAERPTLAADEVPLLHAVTGRKDRRASWCVVYILFCLP